MNRREAVFLLPLAMLPSQDGLFLETQMTTEAGTVTVAPQPTETEVSESIQAGYDRIANPEKAQEDPPKKEEPAAPTAEAPPAAETPAEPAFDNEQIKAVMAQVSRIPELEKQLRDAGGRYGGLKKSLDELQQRMAAPGSTGTADVEDMLKDIKEEFGEDGLYTSLKSAFSKLAAGKSIDPGAVQKMVSDQIAAIRQAEEEEAIEVLTDAHPTWTEDRGTPDFKEWVDSLSAKDRNRFFRSKDPFYVADKLDDFKEWKAKKVTPPAAKEDPPAPVVTPKTEHAPSKRLTNAVLPTNGAKPKPAGEDNAKESIRAGYERVAGARMR